MKIKNFEKFYENVYPFRLEPVFDQILGFILFKLINYYITKI